MLPLLTPKLPNTPERRQRAASLSRLVERLGFGARRERRARERRAGPRVAVSFSLQADSALGGRVLQAHDLSTFGLATATGPTPHLGTRTRLRLYLPDDPSQPVEIDARVVGGFDAVGGARLCFVNPPLEAVRRVHRLVQ